MTSPTGGGTPPPIPSHLAAAVGAWIARDPDPATRAELEGLLAAGDEAGLHARFDRPLGFGTAGLRGELGAGPGRMNRAVVRQTTAGVAAWIAERGDAAREAGLVVGYDARHGSATFAADTAAVAAGAGVRTFLFGRPLPTPITAFAVRHLGAAAGVMITASHNPAADNGYKAYAADGAQVIPPDDGRITTLAAELGPPAETQPAGARALVEDLDDAALLSAYTESVTRVLDPAGPRALRAVYTPLHGVGGAVLPGLFVDAGFDPPVPVPGQAEPDPDFPTVAFPNPEEPGALDLAVAEARRVAADVVLANDPDADRLAVAFADGAGRFRMLTGDDLGALLADYLLSRTTGGARLVATTVVSSSLLSSLAAEAGVDYAETLTGFKWIARAAVSRPGRHLLFGYEEALGYAATEAVADKDGLSAALIAAELAALEKAAGRTLGDRLDDVASRLGVHLTAQLSLRGPDEAAIARFAAVMVRLRRRPPAELAGLAVTEVVDYLAGGRGLPPADVLAWHLGRAARVVVRPSGTEPKLKAYLEVVTEPLGRSGLATARHRAGTMLAELRRAVSELLAG